MVTAYILYTEIVNNEGESNGAPTVVPETWGGWSLVVSMLVQMGGEEVVGQFADLLESIDPLLDLEVYPAIAGKGIKSIFINKFLWDDGELDFDIFMAVQGRTELEVSDIKTGKGCLRHGEGAVDEERHCFERRCTGACVSQVFNTVATDGDTSAERV